MAFKIVKDRRAWWPVTWKGVSEDGAIVENKIELRFRLLKLTDAVALARKADAVRAKEAANDAIEQLPQLYGELVAEIAVDWRGVSAENGEPLPWSAENVALLMNEPGLFIHVFDAFRDCLNAKRDDPGN